MLHYSELSPSRGNACYHRAFFAVFLAPVAHPVAGFGASSVAAGARVGGADCCGEGAGAVAERLAAFGFGFDPPSYEPHMEEANICWISFSKDASSATTGTNA
mmetsp:Transcript_27364/g.43453  ORF Transcript_27364/g.43453 Transcript_27364/m.43453 type:complete len:103 (-) Transcript_27364:2410-2718(-)